MSEHSEHIQGSQLSGRSGAFALTTTRVALGCHALVLVAALDTFSFNGLDQAILCGRRRLSNCVDMGRETNDDNYLNFIGLASNLGGSHLSEEDEAPVVSGQSQKDIIRLRQIYL